MWFCIVGDVTTQVALQPALKFNGGGHINHTIFWTNLSPNGGGEPQGKSEDIYVRTYVQYPCPITMVSASLLAGELMEAIKRDFGSFEKMKEKMSAATVAVQGSGWGWLGYSKDSGRLSIAACANQDPLQGTTGWFKNGFGSPIVALFLRHMIASVSDPQVSSLFLVLMSGSMPTTFSTRMCDQTMLRLFGTLSTGRTWPNVSRLPKSRSLSTTIKKSNTMTCTWSKPKRK